VSSIIAFLTDFGTKDPYVAAMKAVALSIAPNARIVDITHEIKPFDIEGASFTLLAVYQYFPRGTIFVVVVDPGVGSERRPILIETQNYFFIGPDNGVLVPAAEEDGIKRVIVLDNPSYHRQPVSASFHGRDIFTPAAAWLARGIPPHELGSETDPSTLVKPKLKLEAKAEPGKITLKVVHVDVFGNTILSARWNKLAELAEEAGIRLEIGAKLSVANLSSGKTAEAVVERVFSLVPEGTLVLYRDSFDFAELAGNRGSAARLLAVKKGDTIVLEQA